MNIDFGRSKETLTLNSWLATVPNHHLEDYQKRRYRSEPAVLPPRVNYVTFSQLSLQEPQLRLNSA